MCQQGCNSAFKTLAELDMHVKNTHGINKSTNIYICQNCGETFSEIHSMRIHIQKEHSAVQECEYCRQKFHNKAQLEQHITHCENGFKRVEVPVCRYFVNGFCRKGNYCTFSHKTNKSNLSLCRNGPGCPYKARGTCRFSHPYQNRNILQSQIKKCHYMDDCRRVPFCPFSHYEQDFPPLSKNHPPETSQLNIERWQEY